MLVLTRKPKQQIQIGHNITVTIVRVSGKAVRVGIDAPDEVRVVRSELAGRRQTDLFVEDNSSAGNAPGVMAVLATA